MVGLLDLPLELREPILLEVVLDTIERQPAQPPPPFKVDSGFRSVEVAEHGFGFWGSDRGFCKSLSRHALQLLHINQQIRDEVIDIVLRRLGQRIDDARLDVTFDIDPDFLVPSTLWATWLSAPFPTFHINALHAQIRYFQVMDSGPFCYSHRSWNYMRDCDEWIDSHVASMLLSFVAASMRTQAGSASVHERQRITTTKRSRPSYRTIQKLVFDIPVDPDIPNSREGLVRCLACPGAPSLSDGEFFCMIPSGKRAALSFARSLHKTLLETFKEVGDWCIDPTSIPRMIFESVGIIELNVHGRLFGRVDLGQILATVPRSEQWCYTGLTRMGFFTWKRATEDKRKTAGFETVNPSVQEHHLLGAPGLICSILAARDGSLLGEAAEISDNDAQTAGQPASGEQVAFTAKALLLQEDGSRITGDATFYCPWWDNWANRHEQLEYDPPGFVSDHSEERPRQEELVLFEGEAIVFPRIPPETIISGDVTFYGRAEEVHEEQPPGST